MACTHLPKREDWGCRIEPWHKKALIYVVNSLFKRKQEGIKFVRLLDVGCGRCYVLKYLSTAINRLLRINVRCYGIDIIGEFERECSEMGFRFYRLDVSRDKLPFPDDYFDIVTAFEVIEHLFIPENFLQEIRRVLKANGIFVLSTPNLRWWVNIILLVLGYQPFIPDTGFYRNYGTFSATLPPGHIRAYVLRGLEEILRAHGFKVIKVLGSSHPYQSTWKGRRTVKAIDNLVARLFPSLSYDLLLFCRVRGC